MELKQIQRRYLIPRNVLRNWIACHQFPIETKGRSYFVDSRELNRWIDNTIFNAITGTPFYIGAAPISRKSQNVINKAETSFLHEYLYKQMPPHVEQTVQQKEFDALKRDFFGYCTRSRWFETFGGVLGFEGLEQLKREGARLGNLLGFEARLYALYIRSLGCTESKRHPDFNTYVNGMLAAGTFDNSLVDAKIVAQAKEKYGVKEVKGLANGSCHWEPNPTKYRR